jgi:hypothetical protein
MWLLVRARRTDRAQWRGRRGRGEQQRADHEQPDAAVVALALDLVLQLCQAVELVAVVHWVGREGDMVAGLQRDLQRGQLWALAVDVRRLRSTPQEGSTAAPSSQLPDPADLPSAWQTRNAAGRRTWA